MDALTISQTIFYSVSSLVIIVLGALLALVLYRLFKTVKDVQAFTRDVKNAYLKLRGFVSKFTKGKNNPRP